MYQSWWLLTGNQLPNVFINFFTCKKYQELLITNPKKSVSPAIKEVFKASSVHGRAPHGRIQSADSSGGKTGRVASHGQICCECRTARQRSPVQVSYHQVYPPQRKPVWFLLAQATKTIWEQVVNWVTFMYFYQCSIVNNVSVSISC